MNPLKPIIDYIEKARSRIYGVFAFWVLLCLAPVIFTSIFVDQNLIAEKKNLLKNEYIRSVFFDMSSWKGLLYVISIIFISSLMTYLMIWVLPKKLIKAAYEQEIDAHFERESMKLKREDMLDKEKRRLANKKLETVKQEEVVQQKQEEIETRVFADWDKEYSQFSTSVHYNHFYLIPEAIYEHYGNIKVHGVFEIPTNLVAYADGAGLIDVNVKERTIKLTEKGRYFLSKYQVERK